MNRSHNFFGMQQQQMCRKCGRTRLRSSSGTQFARQYIQHFCPGERTGTSAPPQSRRIRMHAGGRKRARTSGASTRLENATRRSENYICPLSGRKKPIHSHKKEKNRILCSTFFARMAISDWNGWDWIVALSAAGLLVSVILVGVGASEATPIWHKSDGGLSLQA